MSTGTDAPSVPAEPETTTVVDHSPVRLSSYIATGLAFVAALTSAPHTMISLFLGLGGLLTVAGGLYIAEKRSWVTVGSVGLFLAAILAGAYGTPVEFVLPSVAASILTWDIGQNAISLGEQLGQHTHTRRAQLVHAGVSVVVAVLVSGFAYAVFRMVEGGQPVAALVLLLLGVVLLIWAYRT